MKYLKKKEKARLPVILIAVCFVAVLAFLGWLIWKPDTQAADRTPAVGGSETSPPTEQTDPQQTDPTEGTTAPLLDMPYEALDGKLRIDSVFQFTGMNPDYQDEWVENVAAVQVTNTTGEHLASAIITITMGDGTTASLAAYDVPAGKSVLAVCPDNVVIETNPECIQITAAADFLPTAPVAADKLQVSVNGTDITVVNISGEDLGRITVYCHGMLGDSCYGGTVRPYEIDSLPAGETALVSAWDCYLGLVEVVRIEIGSE